jgi:hypothetical protein
MVTQNAGGGDASVGVGPGNDRQGGAAAEDGSQRDSGGSGGKQMTRGLDDTGSGAPSGTIGAKDGAPDAAPEGEGSALTAATRGAQDTHSRQAGTTPTGLGAPETGANQSAADLALPK